MFRLALAIFTLILSTISSEAWIRGNPLTPRAFALNLAPVSGGEGAFINELKNCGSLTSTSGYAFPTILDANGYPTSTPANTLTCNITALPTDVNPERTIGFAGTAKLNIQGPASPATIVSDPGSCVTTNSSGNLTISGTNCRVRFTFASAPGSLGVQFPNSGTYSGITDVYMGWTSEIDSYLTGGEIFRPVSDGYLLSKLVDLGVSTLRFLDWNNIADQNTVSQWSFLGRQTSFSYAGSRWEPTVFGATPITGTDTYSGPATSGSTSSYVDGQVYQNLVQNANTTTTPCLSVGGGTCATIFTNSGSALSVGSIPANTLSTFVYSSKLGGWLFSNGAMLTRVPVQVMTALCNKLAVNCWYEFPYLFTQASMASYVAYVRDNLNSSLTAYFEFSNEVFNPSASPRTQAQNIGTARLFPDTTINGWDEYALNHRISMGIVTDNWAPRSVSSLVRVMSWQAVALPSNSLIITGTHLTLDASNNYCSGGGCTITTRYDGTGTCSASNTTSGRPVDCTDAFAFAPYYNGAQIGWCTANCTAYANDMSNAIKAADDYASGNSTLMQAALDFVDCDVRGQGSASGYTNCGQRNGTLGALTLLAFSQAGGYYDQYNTLATTWNKTVINYEGAFQNSPPTAARLTALGITTCAGGDNNACATEFTNLINAYKSDARFSRLVYDQFVQFMAYSKSRMPNWYVLGPASNGAAAQVWTLFGSGPTITSTPWQSYSGVKNYAKGN